VADPVIHELESSVLNSLTQKPVFFYRYVDDIALSVPQSELENLFKKFNSYHPRIKFTIDYFEKGDRLDFLNLTITKKITASFSTGFENPPFLGDS